MFEIIPWSKDLNLDQFYHEAFLKGFENNSNQKVLVDCFNNEREKQVWILYYKKRPIGSVAAHTFDVMGENSYRIAARTCVLTDKIDGVYGHALRGKGVITKNQNPTAQFLIPTCIEWAPKGANLYITSNENSAGTQRKVHRTFGPLMKHTGQLEYITDVFYRGTMQSVWKLNTKRFYEVLNLYPRWV